MNVEAKGLELDGQPVHLRVAGDGPGPDPVPVYVHGLPGDGGDWTALLERTGGLAPDLLGFGRSGKGGHLQYTPPALAGFLSGLLDELEVERYRLVAHGSGAAVALELVRSRPAAVDRVLLFSPFVPAALSRWLRRPGLGELLMGSITRRMMYRWYRHGAGGAEEFPAERLEEVWQNFEQGTQRAILRLVRAEAAASPAPAATPRPTPTPTSSAGEPALPSGLTTLLIEGELDPWRRPDPTPSGDRVAFPTGYWPWLHGPAAERAVAFITGAG